MKKKTNSRVNWLIDVTCTRFTHARHIRESDANVACTCCARSAQQGMLLLDPSVHGIYFPLHETSLLAQILIWSLVEMWSEVTHVMQRSTWTLYPLGQVLDTYSTLGNKIEGQNSTLFHQGLNIISPGTNFFLRFEGSRAHHIFTVLKERPGIRHHSYWNR
jgi:hypothetical protein